MDKPKLNKSELTRLRRQIKMYNQFLPVLKLKKERLQAEHLRLKRELAERRESFAKKREAVRGLESLLPEPLPIDLPAMIRAVEIRVEEKVIAGVKVPVLEEVGFADVELPRFGLPPWVNRALPLLRAMVAEYKELEVLALQAECINHELRKATQKVNLFEKVLIPDTKEAVRRIEIALGDQQVAAVCRGKIAKTKQQRAAREAVS
ncbi:MAG: V-type ATP synthase subunit D [Acidobacteriota bacterium]|nr:V-type ATP synthase subunit D [Acidobacteriota bacterium]